MFKGHLVKRYSNRKLYSITESKYLTLPEIGEKFLQGSGFIIRDQKTNEDLTIRYLVKGLAACGHFNEQVEVRNLSNIGANLQEQGIHIHG